jgi:hypothetical protein
MLLTTPRKAHELAFGVQRFITSHERIVIATKASFWTPRPKVDNHLILDIDCTSIVARLSLRADVGVNSHAWV